MQRTQENLVAAQFGPRAGAYVESATHAQGPDLEALDQFVAAARPSRAIDLGAGGGHVSYLLARHAASVDAVDLSADMLAAVSATARGRGLSNIETTAASVDDLPFASGAFDFLASRYSAHHWRDFEGGLREARRVLKVGARAAFIDVFAPEPSEFDTHLQAVELLRDPSHVRNYKLTEWIGALARAGFMAESLSVWRRRMVFEEWADRMRAPEESRRAIRGLQGAASDACQRYFELAPDGSFTLDVLMIAGR